MTVGQTTPEPTKSIQKLPETSLLDLCASGSFCSFRALTHSPSAFVSRPVDVLWIRPQTVEPRKHQEHQDDGPSGGSGWSRRVFGGRGS